MRQASTLSIIAATIGLLAVTACGTMVPTGAESSTDKGFATKQFAGPYGYNNFGPSYGPGYGAWGAGVGGCGAGFGGYPGFGACGYGNVPVAGDIFGGTTFFTGRRFDRQPATLPYGVAEENDEAFRPLGSAIWQRK
jgi:hypothetical protein